MAPTHRIRAIGIATCIAIACAGPACGKDRPPDPAVWKSQLSNVRDRLPTRDEIANASDPRAVCSQALADAREAKQSLFPAPDDVLESAARQWLDVMQAAYMRCDDEDSPDGLDEAFESAAAIERQLDAALGADRP